jgi:hypothetical protein
MINLIGLLLMNNRQSTMVRYTLQLVRRLPDKGLTPGSHIEIATMTHFAKWPNDLHYSINRYQQ